MFFVDVDTGARLSQFMISRSRQKETPDYCSAHMGNVVPASDRYLLVNAWYTGGVDVIDFSNPRAPKEVAYFVPPATENPVKPSQRGVLTNTAQGWGVVVDEATGLVYASDMNSGL